MITAVKVYISVTKGTCHSSTNSCSLRQHAQGFMLRSLRTHASAPGSFATSLGLGPLKNIVFSLIFISSSEELRTILLPSPEGVPYNLLGQGRTDTCKVPCTLLLLLEYHLYMIDCGILEHAQNIPWNV